MKIVFVTPEYEQTRGNTITVRRMTHNLRKSGINTEVVSLSEGQAYKRVQDADLVHGFNAYRFGQYWEEAGNSALPYVVTMTGTDLNHDLFNKERKTRIVDTLCCAAAIHLFNDEAKNKLITYLPEVERKTVIIPQGVSIFSKSSPTLLKEAGTCLFLLPAGIRTVKQVPTAITLLKSVHDTYPRLRLWIAGPIIEPLEGQRVLDLIGQNQSWVRYLGEVNFEQMGELYRQADVGLNTSLSEGQSSAILEMMAHGVPVLASANDGNRDVVRNDQTGLLYERPAEFKHLARKLITNASLRERLGQQGREFVVKYHRPETETENLRRLYLSVLNEKKDFITRRI